METFDLNFPTASFDIVAFIETHHKEESEFPELIMEYKVSHHCLHTPEDKYAGIIILIRKNLLILDSEVLISSRLLNFRMELSHEKTVYNISVFYGQNKINRTQVSENIKEFYTNHNIEDNNIILGDFNFCHRVIDRNVSLHRNDKIWCEPWGNFYSDMNLVDPYRLQYPKRRLLFRIKSRKK